MYMNMSNSQVVSLHFGNFVLTLLKYSTCCCTVSTAYSERNEVLLGHIRVSKNGYRSNSSWVAMVITTFSILMFFTMFGHNSTIETYAIVFRRRKPSRNDHKIYVSKHVSSKSEKFQMGPRTNIRRSSTGTHQRIEKLQQELLSS